MTIAVQALDDRREVARPPGGGEPAGDSTSGRGRATGSAAGHDGLRYEVKGRLDVDTSHEVRDVEQPAPPGSVVEIDLGRCEGMDDFGFGSLVGLIRRARQQRARVRVRGADEEVRDELNRSGVARLVDIVPSASPQPEARR